MAKYVCMICNYDFSKSVPPKACPNCGEKGTLEEEFSEELNEEFEDE